MNDSSKTRRNIGFVSHIVAIAALGCGSDDESQGTASSLGLGGSNVEECSSMLAWWGTFPGAAETAQVEACINDECFPREVVVESDGECMGGNDAVVWDDDWGSVACVTSFPEDPSQLQVAVTLLLSARADELSQGDVGTLRIVDADTETVLYDQSEEIAYVGTPECLWGQFVFGDVDYVTADAGTP